MSRFLTGFVAGLFILGGFRGLPRTIAADGSAERTVTADDMSRIPATEPADALSTFRLAKGCSLEQVAAEPLVSDPIDACFDEFGRMFVAEMHGYPFSQEPTRLNPDGGGLEDAGIIRLLEDTDGDGKMDKSVVFADEISWPTSVCCYNGGVFVLAPPRLYYFKDTDGDDRADVREVVLSGFGRGNVQALANGLRWTTGNKIAFAAGRDPNKLLHRGQPLFPVSGCDLQFDPRTETFERITGGQQFGHSLDDWGTRFVCSNSDHIQQVVFPLHYLERNPFFAVSKAIRSIAKEGPSGPVHRISPPEPWRIVRQKWRAADKGYRLVINDDGGWEFIPLDPSKPAGAIPTEYPAGFFTSATGITIYRGDAYLPEFRGNAFIGDVGGNLVHRKRLTTDRVVYRAERADEGEEIVRSTDNWFRPVNFVNAPDGTLYILDMYRETIEHPHSIPPDIKRFTDLTSGRDRGRIYRLVTPQMSRRKPTSLGSLETRELVEHLSSPNGWHRETAQRLLVERANSSERADSSVVPALTQLLQTADNPLGRLHAFYTLDGLDALTIEHIELALHDDEPRVRARAIQLSERLIASTPNDQLMKSLLSLVDDESEHVRFQLAMTWGESEDERAIDGLTRMAADSRNGTDVRTAILSSVGTRADRLAAALFDHSEFRSRREAASFFMQLGQIVGANAEIAPTLRLLTTAAVNDVPLAVQQAILQGLGRGLDGRGTSLSRILAAAETPQATREEVTTLFHRAADRANDESQPLTERRLAIGLLAFADWELASEKLPPFLDPQTPSPLQVAAIEAFARQNSDEIVDRLLTEWPGFSPAVRRTAIDAVLTKPVRIRMLLDAVADGRVKPHDIERATKQLLLNHPNADIRSYSETIIGGEVESNRSNVVATHQEVLSLTGDATRGRTVFQKTCSVCHRVGDIGHQVAPDLTSVVNKSAADLLIAILDPNREAQPNFNVYNVLTDTGRVYSGIIAAETSGSLTLRRSEAKEDVIRRDVIDELVATGQSLMPEGLEKDLSQQELADVIAFVKSIKPTGKLD